MTLLLASVLAQIGPTTTAAKTSKPGSSLLDPIAKPIAWVLEHIYAVVPNYGVAIVILSIIWMLIIAPLTLKSTRSMLAMQKLQPQLKKLQEQHRNDRQAFAQAQMELFREHNVSPFGACLPTLLPFPVFFALYRVITGLGHKSTINGVPNTPTPKYISHGSQMYHDIVHANGHLNAFWMDLSKNAFSHHSSFGTAAPFWILLLVMAGTGYMQSAQMLNRNPAAAQNPQMRLMKYLPLLFVVIFARLPAGVLVYYAMSNVCRIVQQDLMYRYDPKVKALVTQEVEEVEALTHEIDERGPSAAKDRAAEKGGGATRGKSRFQQLLDTAREQQLDQQKRQDKDPPKSDGNGTGSAKAGGGKAGTTSGNGSGSGNQQSNGRAQDKTPPTNGQAAKGNQSTAGGRTGAGSRGSTGKPTPGGSHRTNRKRRRR